MKPEQLTSLALRAAIRAKYAWPGGYPLIFDTSDGCCLCADCTHANYARVAWSRRHEVNDGWRVEAIDNGGNFDTSCKCDNCGKELCAYIVDEDEPAPTVEDDRALILYADSSRGVYIPQHFAESIIRENLTGVTADELATLESGPDSEWYWETWERVLNNATVTAGDGTQYSLHQDGDLWLYAYPLMTAEQRANFFGE